MVKAFYNKSKKFQIDVSLNLDKYHFPIKTIEFNLLRPGFLFKANVIRNLSNGIEISFGGNVGSIFVDQVPNEKKEKNIMARIIHLSLNKKFCGLSAMSHIKKLLVENVNEKENLIGKLCAMKVTKILYGGSAQGQLIEKDEENKKENIICENAFLHIKISLNLKRKIKKINTIKRKKKKK